MDRCEDSNLNPFAGGVDTDSTPTEAEDLAEFLALAHHPPDPDSVGRRPTTKESAALDDAADNLFLDLTAEEQALYLSEVSSDEAATDLQRLTPSRRAAVFNLLPSTQKQAVAHNWDHHGKVLSA